MEWRFSDADVLVCAAIIEQIMVAPLHRAFNEYYIRNLADFLPRFFGREDWLIAPPDQFSRIITVKHRNCRAIDEFVICAVVNQKDSIGSHDRSRPRFRHARIEASRPDRQHGSLSRFRPMK